MGMNWGSNNWVKDGLDAYLALSGEKRAEDNAQSDREYRKQGMQLALSADQRAAKTADLSNQASQLTIDENKRKVGDQDRFRSTLQDFITMKTASDPSIPNSTDPEEMAASRQTAADLAHTAQLLNNIPPGAAELTMDSLPAAAQKVMMEGPVKAAAMRTGITHSDPQTGQTYTMTGEMGPVRIVREEGKPAIVIPTMLAKNEDGTVREVPYTEGKSNDANDPVKYITADMLTHRAGATLTALDMADKTGVSPTVAYSQNMLKMVESLPYEQQVTWMNGELAKESARRDKYVTDAETAKQAEPFAARIDSLTGSAEDKRKAATAIMLGAPSSVADHLLKTSKSVHELFPKEEMFILNNGAKGFNAKGDLIAENPKSDENYAKTVKVDVGGGNEQTFQWNDNTRQFDIPVGKPGPKHAPRANDPEDIRSKRDIAIRLRDAQRGHQNALKTGDPDTINAAVDTIESLNSDAVQYGVTPQPVPQRPFTSAENDAIKAQALKNLKEQRQGIAKFFGTEPNVIAVNAEARRIKQTVKPGGVSFGDQQAAPTSAPSAMPPPGQHSGRIIRDTVTGRRYQSNGTSWVGVQ